MNLAPIVLFVYNRPYCLSRCIDALKNNHYANNSELIIYSDGNKSIIDKNEVESVRKYLKTISGFRKITVIEREKNYGLADSIIGGVTEVLQNNEKVIVLEDDMVTSPFFLEYMNRALELYKNDEITASVNGFFAPVKRKLPDTFFLNFADCWGWRTWKRAWKDFEKDGNVLLTEIIKRNLSYKFDLNGTVDYTKMLADQVEGKNNSWAIRWYASAFLKNKLSLCPKHSLVQHIGNDGSGTHFGKTDFLSVELILEQFDVKRVELVENKRAFIEMVGYFKKFNLCNREKHFIPRQVIPPFLLPVFRKLKKNKPVDSGKPKYGWFGDYPNWEYAKTDCTGYDYPAILEKVISSVLKVKNGEAAFERDSVLFDKPDYSFPFLSALMWITGQCKGKLNVLDFGGSLGSTYFQYKLFFDKIDVKWNIVEQKEFVSKGKQYIEDDNLKFYYSISDCLKEHKPECLILSSVLQYLEEPYAQLNQMLGYGFNYILIARTAFINGNDDLLTVQRIPSQIYDASYPAWFLSFQKFLYAMEKNAYELVFEFDDKYTNPVILANNASGFWKGFVFRRKI